MPVLKKLFSLLGLRNDARDADLPNAQRESVLHRSNAVLKKRPRPHGSDIGLSLDDLLDQRDPRRDALPLAGAQLEDEPFSDWMLARRHSVQELDDEMQAMAQLRAAQHQQLARFRQTLEAVDEAEVPYRRAREPVLGGRYTHQRELLRYRDPLLVVRQGRLRNIHRSASAMALSSHQAHHHPNVSTPQAIDEWFDAIDSSWQRSPGVARSTDSQGPLLPDSRNADARREAWVHKRKTARSSSPTDSAFALPDDEPAAEFAATGASYNKRATASEGESSLLKVWLDRQEGLARRRFADIDERDFAAEHGSEHGASNAGPGGAQSDEELALLLAADQLLDAPNGPASSPQQRDCSVCGDSRNPLDFPPSPSTPACEHTAQTCSDCLESWMASEIDTKGTEGIKCPECPQDLSYADIQRAASASTFATYDTLTVRAALGALADFAWCLSPTCTSGQENLANANFMDCHACGYKQCLSHRVPWHTDETCGEYDYRTSGQRGRDEERATAAMLDSVSKACPNPKGCGWRIQKVDGCDHMTCRRCRWEFCWCCGASQKEIRRVGNTAHEGSCRYHSRNLEVAWPFNAH